MMTNGKGGLAGFLGVTVFCILAAVPIQAQTSQQGITGIWLNLEMGAVWQFTGNRLRVNGQVMAEYRLDGQAVIWKSAEYQLDKDRMRWNHDGAEPEARVGYEIRNTDTLILTVPGSKGPVEFTRAKNDPALYGKWFRAGQTLEFTEDNRFIMGWIDDNRAFEEYE